MAKKITQSPIPPEKESAAVLAEQIDFYNALRQLAIEGKKITKLEWGNNLIYGILKDNVLKIHKADNRYYDWIISDGDLAGEDWIVLD